MAWYVPDRFASSLERYMPSFRQKGGPVSVSIGQSSGWPNWRRHCREFKRAIPPYDTEELTLLSNPRCLPDVFKRGGTAIVNDAFRQIADKLEPGANECYPVKIYDLKEVELPTQYWALNVIQSSDSIVEELSDVYWRESRIPSRNDRVIINRLMLFRPKGRLVMSKEKIAGLHLWRTSHQLTGCYFFSDELMRQCVEARLRVFDAIYAEEA